MYEDTEERIDRLESVLGHFIVQTNTSLTRLEREMRTFKNEMRVFKNEMGDFKNEMLDFKNEVRREQKETKKQWGDLANKMGTLVEDIIAPAVRPIIKRYFNCETEYYAVNVRKNRKDINLKGEFDVVATGDNNVFLVEAKSKPNKEHLSDLLKKIERFGKLFPEYQDRKLIPIFAGLRFEDDLILLASENNIYVMAYKEWDYMDILNFDKISP